MPDLRSDTQALWRSMSRMATHSDTPAVMFMAPERNCGVSSITAAIATQAAERVKRPAWLVDLDLRTNPVFQGFEHGAFGPLGLPGRAYDASLGTEQVFELRPPFADGARQPKLMTACQVDGLNLLVTRFRAERLRHDQRVRLRSAPDWWTALRAASDWILVDAPALSRSSAGLVAAAEMDGVILVAEADRTQPKDLATLRGELESHGGRVLGVVMNRAKQDAQFVERMLG